MSSVFADSFYYLALGNPRDAAHTRAHQISSGLTANVVTTTSIIQELAAASPNRPLASASFAFSPVSRPIRKQKSCR